MVSNSTVNYYFFLLSRTENSSTTKSLIFFQSQFFGNQQLVKSAIMSFSSTSATRKARRKEEREQKKQKNRAKHGGNNSNAESNNKAAVEESPKKRKADPKPQRSPGKKSKRSSTSNTRTISAPRGDYANLPPEVAAAMRRDDDEIADLEAKLGLSEGARSRLNREYATKECFGEDFGAFLSGLDDLCKQILTSPPQEFSEDEASCSSSDTSISHSMEEKAAE